MASAHRLGSSLPSPLQLVLSIIIAVAREDVNGGEGKMEDKDIEHPVELRS